MSEKEIELHEQDLSNYEFCSDDFEFNQDVKLILNADVVDKIKKQGVKEFFSDPDIFVTTYLKNKQIHSSLKDVNGEEILSFNISKLIHDAIEEAQDFENKEEYLSVFKEVLRDIKI